MITDKDSDASFKDAFGETGANNPRLERKKHFTPVASPCTEKYIGNLCLGAIPERSSCKTRK